MIRPVDCQPFEQMLLDLEKTVSILQRGIALLRGYANVGSDNATARTIINAQGINLAGLAYQFCRRVDVNAEAPLPLTLENNVPLPFAPTPEQLDAAIYHTATRIIADVAHFTGNLCRINGPSTHLATAELIHDWAVILAKQMAEEVARYHQPKLLLPDSTTNASNPFITADPMALGRALKRIQKREHDERRRQRRSPGFFSRIFRPARARAQQERAYRLGPVETVYTNF